MSLFGGDDTAAPSTTSRQSQERDSDFSITPIPSPREVQTNIEDATFAQHQQPQDDEHFESSFDGGSEEDEDGLDIDEEARLNRFQGLPTQWRDYTRQERLLARSLDQLKASDLSTHLYNVHAWKARLRRSDDKAPSAAIHRKTRWIDKDGQGQKSWYPEHLWTAWPIEAEGVPRPGEMFGASANDISCRRNKTKRDARLREDLEEDIYGLVERQARVQWLGRMQDDGFIAPVRRSTSGSRRSLRSRSVSQIRDLPDPKPDPILDPELSEDDVLQSDEDDVHSEASDDPGNRPIPSADVNRIKALLQPSVNHMLSRLDSLLAALCHNRQGLYGIVRDQSASPDAVRKTLSRSRSRSTRRLGKQTLKRHRERRDSSLTRPEGIPDEVRGRSNKRMRSSTTSTASEEDSRGRSRSADSAESEQSRGGTHTTNPRDWSEVLGLAAMTGWDSGVLERAASRCAVLFDEGMSFRVIAEEPETTPADAASAMVCLPTKNLVPGSLRQPLRQSPVTQKALVYRCPEEDCLRHSKTYVTTKGFRFREHLRRKHGYTAEDVRDTEQAMQMSGAIVPTTTKNPRGWIAPKPLLCPLPECSKASGTPFPESRRLVDHLIRVHKYDPRKQSPPGKPLVRRQSVDPTSDAESLGIPDVDSDDEMVGGVHNDGFLKPIAYQVRGRGRNKTKQLD